MNIQKAYTATDVHVAGEAFRIIRDAPLVHYENLLELNEQLPFVYGEEIKLLLNEPRGFAGMNGCLVVPPFSREADVAAVFFNHEGTVAFQYGGVVAIVTALLECGHLSPKESNEYIVETVSGMITVHAFMENGEVTSVKLESGYCHVVQDSVPVSHANIRTQYSLVQADRLYAIFNKREVAIELDLINLSELQKWGRMTNEALINNEAISEIILLDDSSLADGQMTTIAFRKDHFIVRTPGFEIGAACLTKLLTEGALSTEQPIENRSIFNSSIVVEQAGQQESQYKYTFTSRGFVTGMQTFVLDPTDPLSAGFLLK